MLSKSEADVTQEDTLTPSLNLPDKARGTSSRKFQDILHRIMNKEHDKSSDTLQALLRGNILGQTSYVPACPTVSDDADSPTCEDPSSCKDSEGSETKATQMKNMSAQQLMEYITSFFGSKPPGGSDSAAFKDVKVAALSIGKMFVGRHVRRKVQTRTA
ncbi:hypothetical protein CYMTET_39680 [Cymbomonas tetramitiformis]|uniref:Uncharacterized protein n=1 Tax=Cymbomonas tetramitiformis TaxID=36881 RepID=A0AAE0CAT6_9CHLO|nr:hypothetical protein CYMTET_39680 [Cymbomonas tetramitiformis]